MLNASVFLVPLKRRSKQPKKERRKKNKHREIVKVLMKYSNTHSFMFKQRLKVFLYFIMFINIKEFKQCLSTTYKYILSKCESLHFPQHQHRHHYHYLCRRFLGILYFFLLFFHKY